MSVGSLIDGAVAANVPAKGAVVIAAGAPVGGRIRRLERYSDPMPHFVVALEFTEVELQGIRHRFYADVVEIQSSPGVEQTLSTPTKTEELVSRDLRTSLNSSNTLHFSNLPGVATFFFKGDTLALPVGFRTTWKTRKLAP